MSGPHLTPCDCCDKFLFIVPKKMSAHVKPEITPINFDSKKAVATSTLEN